MDSNFCRNPFGLSKAFCYTMHHQIEWEECDIPICDDGKRNIKTEEVRVCKEYKDEMH